MRRSIQPDKRLVQPFSYVQNEQLATDKPIAQYIRQSSDKQLKNNKQSTALQDEDMRKRLLSMGWKESLIVKLASDNGTSGTKDMSDRVDMKELYRLIKHGEVSAVAVYDASRLFRPIDTYKDASLFVDICHEKNIPVLTWHKIYWCGRRQDKDELFVALMSAAKDLQSFLDRTQPARLRHIEEDISYGGHAVPIGFTVVETEERKHYAVYEPHSTLVAWLFRRFRALDGNIARLGRECQSTRFIFPAFPADIKNKPHIALKETSKGYECFTRQALVGILTNVAYIGWYLYNGSIVSKTAHEPIVPMDDFLYAYNRLSPTTLTGEANESKPATSRRTGIQVPALLEDILTSNGNPCYVMTEFKAYIARAHNGAWNYTMLSVPVAMLDKSVTGALMTALVALEQRARDGLQDSVHAELVRMQEQKEDETSLYAAQLANIDKLVKQAEMDKKIALEEQYEPGVRDAIRQLKQLLAQRAAIEDKAQNADSELAELAECKDLFQQATNRWDALSFEKQKRFCSLLIETANITEASPHMLQVTVTLRAPLQATLTGYIFRTNGSKPKWTPDETMALKKLYKHADRLDVMRAIPDRSWESIILQAGKMGMIRHTRINTSGIDKYLSYADYELMQSIETGNDVPFTVDDRSLWATSDISIVAPFSKATSGTTSALGTG